MGNSNVFKRNAGILMAISSLPSPYGIGTSGKDKGISRPEQR